MQGAEIEIREVEETKKRRQKGNHKEREDAKPEITK